MAEFSWQGRKAFITGGRGFLGSHLAKRLLDKGAYVTCFVRGPATNSILSLLDVHERVQLAFGDIVDADAVERAMAEQEAQAVFHLAAQPIVGTASQSPLPTFETNIRGTWNVLEAARKVRSVTRVVVASSDKVYGAHEVLPFKEDSPLVGLRPYDASKVCTDILARTYASTYDLAVTVTRSGNIYGGGDLNWNRLVPDTIRALCNEKSPVIRSDGQFKRDFLYVEDAADAYLSLAEATPDPMIRGRAFNLGQGEPVPILEIVDMLCELHGEHLAPTILNVDKFEIRDHYLDCTLLRERLGWAPKNSLVEGLKKTYHWYRDYLSRAVD